MTQPTAPEPDEKDWTWVLDEPCPDCGFDARAVDRRQIPDLVHCYVNALQAALKRPDASTRPQPQVWAVREYGCHVRDVCRIFEGRLQLMLTEHDPQFDNWDQDATALDNKYWEQHPATVSADLGTAAAKIADTFAAVDSDQWLRPGRRSNGSVFTVDTFARYFLHDLAHHAWDVNDAQG
jgi:hypothetical protein